MELGLLYDFSNPPEWKRPVEDVYRQQLEQIRWAEQIGIENVWFTEHHFWEDGYLPSPVIAATAAAASTSRMRIGTSVLLGPLYEPIRLAEDLAVLDAVSGGRLEVGIGLGWAPLDYETYGVDPSRRVGRLKETIEVLRLAWTTDDFTFHGQHFALGPVTVTPRPAQRPHPRLWGGASRPEAGRRLGRWGLSLLWMDPPVVDAYLAGRQEVGLPNDNVEVGGFLFMFVCDDPDRDWERIRPHLHYHRARYSAAGRNVTESFPLDDLDRHEMRRRFNHMVLSPHEAIAELEARARAIPCRLNNVHFFASLPGLDRDLSDRHVELLATVVGPALRNDDKPDLVER